jgi:ssRNA-specific RNase YbeY (16S rRNA maturation enzyme)
VIIHGVLHLCGYPDKSEAEARKMRAKEDEALALFDSGFSAD